MPTEDELFQKQISLLETAANILEDRIEEIDAIASSRVFSKDSDSESQGSINVFFVKLLKFYLDDLLSVIIFYSLLNERANIDKKIYFFLLPNVRTLLDIYAKFIYLFKDCQNTAEQAKVCIASQLLVSKALGNEQMYQEGLNSYSNFLAEIKLNFPKKLSDYSKEWVKNNKLKFSKNSELLTEKNIKKYSSKASGVFGSGEMYCIYAQLSEYLHGNPFYYIKEAHNEKYWVISYTIIITTYLIDFIDLMVLKKMNRKDFSLWLVEVNKNRKDLSDSWSKNRISPHKN